MPKKHEWERDSWTRPDDKTLLRLRTLRLWLIEQTEGLADSDPLPFTLADVRDILSATEPGSGDAGAVLKDKERGVSYRVTLDPSVGSVGLRTVEVITNSTTDPSVFRVPVAELVREAAAVQAFGEDGRRIIVVGSKGGTPSPETLLSLIKAKVSRADIAKRFGNRSVGRVDVWLREARTSRPDLDWPPVTRGPRPTKTTNGK